MAYTQEDLLEAGVHFGHLTRKWNPKWHHTYLWSRMAFT